MSNDHLADRVRIDESDIKDEGYEVVVENDRLEVEISSYECPGHETGEQSNERRN